MVLDLDPGEGADLVSCAAVAFYLRDILDAHGLQCLSKVSGSKGLQGLPLGREARYSLIPPPRRINNRPQLYFEHLHALEEARDTRLRIFQLFHVRQMPAALQSEAESARRGIAPSAPPTVPECRIGSKPQNPGSFPGVPAS
jgi:hypothetical protein